MIIEFCNKMKLVWKLGAMQSRLEYQIRISKMG